VTWCLDEACEGGKVSHYEKPLFNRAQIEARLILRDTPNGHGRRGKRPLGLPLAQMHVRIGTVDMTVTDKQVKIMLLLADEIDRMLTTIRLSKESTTRSSNAGAGVAGGGSHNGGQLGVLDELQVRFTCLYCSRIVTSIYGWDAATRGAQRRCRFAREESLTWYRFAKRGVLDLVSVCEERSA
jgi:hypothetical protein